MNQQTPVISLAKRRLSGNEPVHFNKNELFQILNIYGKMVSAGIWRDYCFEEGAKSISFNVFKRSSDQPLYRIQKTPLLANKQGAFAIESRGGMIIKRGHNLDALLGYFHKKLYKIVD